MTWFKLDDNFYAHPKVISAPAEAIGLWTLAASWCAQQLTDGYVPERALALLGGTPAIADALIGVGLWEPETGGYRFHDWNDYQPDAASIRATRDAKSEGGMQGNHTRWHAARGIRVPVCALCFPAPDRSSDRISDEVSDGVSESPPIPPVPDPTRETPIGVSSQVGSFTCPGPEVDRLLDMLDAEIRRNGSKTPQRTKSNRSAMRLLLGSDGRTVAEVEEVIQWCQADGFWRGNILSATKLREKFDQLRLQMLRTHTTRVSRAEKNLAYTLRIATDEATEQKAVASW